jgi:hypothetical protein
MKERLKCCRYGVLKNNKLGVRWCERIDNKQLELFEEFNNGLDYLENVLFFNSEYCINRSLY